MLPLIRQALNTVTIGCPHSAFPTSFAFAVLTIASTLSVRAQIPIEGFPVPDLSVLDDEMTSFMESNDISAGSLSVMRNGAIIFHHTYGWSDQEKTVPLDTDALFRVASVTKPFTAAAIRKLISEGKLTLNTKVFSLGVPSAGILDHAPFGTPDSRLKNITIDHLINHLGGWDLSIAGDLTFRERQIADEMDVPKPPGRDNTIRYTMGQPLQYDPGSTYAYSNIGYMLLGLIIEEVSGQAYQAYLQEHIIGPSGSKASEWQLASTFKEDQDPREPHYDDPTTTINVFFPDNSSTFSVELPYGGFDTESLVGHGGMVAHGFVLLRFADQYQIGSDGVGGPKLGPGTWRISQIGSLPGTNALMSQRSDGINFAVIFNKRPPSDPQYAETILSRIEAIFDSGKITTWPTVDVSRVGVEPPKVGVSIDFHSLRCETVPGWEFQWQRSTDVSIWENYLEPFSGTGFEVVKPLMTSEEMNFFRLNIRH